VLAARLVGPAGAVIAFEPLPETAKAARRNADLNGFTHATVLTCAAGKRGGTAQLEPIAAHHPVILCQMHGKNAAFASLMDSLGYTVRTLENNLPLAEARWDVHAVATPRVRGSA
jgi:FkbM family methyltransferase